MTEPEGPMNLGPKNEILPVRRDTLESLLVTVGMIYPANLVNVGGRKVRMEQEQSRLRRILRDGRDSG